jgi:hypothetical protein
LINGRLIIVWVEAGILYISYLEEGRLPQAVDLSQHEVRDLKISGDGFKVFCLSWQSIQAWSIWTGEVMSEVQLDHWLSPESLTVDGSRVWAHFPYSPTKGWDFGLLGLSSPILLPKTPLDRPHLDFIDNTKEWNTGPCRIKDTATGKDVFQLPGRYTGPSATQWDGQYLVAGYNSGEVVIMDFNHLYAQ